MEDIPEHLKNYYPQDYILKYTLIPLMPKFISPNSLTVLRFICTPFVLILLLNNNFTVGIPFFIFTAFTDVVDGSIARVTNRITKWGIFYDPIADKLLIGSVLLLFVAKYLSINLAITLILVEIFILSTRYFLKKKHNIIAANIFGKLKMLSQVIGVIIVMLGAAYSNQTLLNISMIVLILSIPFALGSLIKDVTEFRK